MAGRSTTGLPVRLPGKQILLIPERFSKNILSRRQSPVWTTEVLCYFSGSQSFPRQNTSVVCTCLSASDVFVHLTFPLLVPLLSKCCFGCSLIPTALPPQFPCHPQTSAAWFLCFSSSLPALSPHAGSHQDVWPGLGSVFCLASTVSSPLLGYQPDLLPCNLLCPADRSEALKQIAVGSKMSLIRGNLARSMLLADG